MVVLALLSTLAECQAPGTIEAPGVARILTWTPPSHLDPPFPTQLRKIAMVIKLTCKDQNGRIRPAGATGFLVSYADSRLPKGQGFLYLVTNRHVVECWDENNKPREVQSTELTVKMKDGSSVNDPLVGMHWRFPADDSADLAVATISFNANSDFLSIPLEMFFTKDLFATDNIGEGAKIILSGYFYQLEGEQVVQPIIREGILSMIPDGPLMTTAHKRGSIYLADVHIFGGNSGSPVFISTAGIRADTIQFLDDYRFLGVVSGYYYEDSDFNLEIATLIQGKQRANSGVSMIVTADVLKDLILNDPELKAARDSMISSTKSPSAPR
jgi:hypothetical protein